MKTVKLNNGLKMPVFGLGTFKVDAGESAYDTVLSALKIGYRHIDTAAMYKNGICCQACIKDQRKILYHNPAQSFYNKDQWDKTRS